MSINEVRRIKNCSPTIRTHAFISLRNVLLCWKLPASFGYLQHHPSIVVVANAKACNRSLISNQITCFNGICVSDFLYANMQLNSASVFKACRESGAETMFLSSDSLKYVILSFWFDFNYLLTASEMTFWSPKVVPFWNGKCK